jgi:hypothetical protein
MVGIKGKTQPASEGTFMVFGNPLREIRCVGGKLVVECGNAADRDGQNQQVQVSRGKNDRPMILS